MTPDDNGASFQSEQDDPVFISLSDHRFMVGIAFLGGVVFTASVWAGLSL